MSPKKQDNTFPSIRVSDKLREETEKCADMEDEKITEYIRNAVEERNKRVLRKKVRK